LLAVSLEARSVPDADFGDGTRMSDAKRCDNCGIHGYEPYNGWRHVEALGVDIIGWSREHDFCSWVCMAQRAQLMAFPEARTATIGGKAPEPGA
jgi:hypothetical protein